MGRLPAQSLGFAKRNDQFGGTFPDVLVKKLINKASIVNLFSDGIGSYQKGVKRLKSKVRLV